MIAPLGSLHSEAAETRRRLHFARRLVALTFFRDRPEPASSALPISAWLAWAFAGWVVIVAGVYFAAMLGFL